MRLSASQLADYDRCGLQWAYKRDPARVQVGFSASSFGGVMHHALHVLERTWATPFGQVDHNALEAAQATFTHYWHPEHIAEVALPVVDWQRGHSWNGLNEKGPHQLADYAELRAFDDAVVLALEFPFEVPLVGTEHTVSGFIDKLAVRKYMTKPYLSQDDYKTGRTKTYLRHDVQGHIYSYATTQREFWEPFGDRAEELWRAYLPLARRFRWVSLSDNKKVDTWRTERDYDRLRLMVNAVAKAIEEGIFIPTLNGQACQYCSFAANCGDLPLPADDDGKPQTIVRPAP